MTFLDEYVNPCSDKPGLGLNFYVSRVWHCDQYLFATLNFLKKIRYMERDQDSLN